MISSEFLAPEGWFSYGIKNITPVYCSDSATTQGHYYNIKSFLPIWTTPVESLVDSEDIINVFKVLTLTFLELFAFEDRLRNPTVKNYAIRLPIIDKFGQG